MSSSGYLAWNVTAGEVPTTAYWNILGANDASFNTGNGFNDGIIISRHIASGAQVIPPSSNPYKFSVYRNASWSQSNLTSFICDTITYDSASGYNTSTGIYTIQAAGYYHLYAEMNFGVGSNNYVGYGCGMTFTGGSVSSIEISAPYNFDVYTNCEVNRHFNVGDTIQMLAYTSGVAGGTGQGVTFMEGFMISGS